MSRLASAKGIFDRGREMVNKVASFEGAIEIIEAKRISNLLIRQEGCEG